MGGEVAHLDHAVVPAEPGVQDTPEVVLVDSRAGERLATHDVAGGSAQRGCDEQPARPHQPGDVSHVQLPRRHVIRSRVGAIGAETTAYGARPHAPSGAIAGPSVDENRNWIARLEEAFQGAIDHFGVTLRAGTTVGDLAVAVAGVVEGLWLNQCLTDRHPTDPSQPIATAMLRSGRLLWHGATLA